MNYVSFYDALRFANWLHNGQPTGAQGAATTETGPTRSRRHGDRRATLDRDAQRRAPDLPDRARTSGTRRPTTMPRSASYFDYPAGSNTQTICATPTASAEPAPTATRGRRPATSRPWAATRARRAPTAPSTRAETSRSGTRRSARRARAAGCAAGRSTGPGGARRVDPGSHFRPVESGIIGLSRREPRPRARHRPARDRGPARPRRLAQGPRLARSRRTPHRLMTIEVSESK